MSERVPALEEVSAPPEGMALQPPGEALARGPGDAGLHGSPGLHFRGISVL